MRRCSWANSSELERDYHDREWGVPVHDDRLLFEFLILEGAQAGLSWSTILNKREAYRKVFNNFDPEKITGYSKVKIEKLLKDKRIVRNRLKVNATVTNARAFLEVQKEFGSFAQYIWQFVDGKPLQNSWGKMAEVPTSSAEAKAMSTDLKRRGFKFVGETICYAFMQATGMINDHTLDCFRHRELKT